MAKFDDGPDAERIEPAEAAAEAAREWRDIARLMRQGIRSQVETATGLGDPAAVLDFARAVGIAMSVEHAALTFELDAERERNRPYYES